MFEHWTRQRNVHPFGRKRRLVLDMEGTEALTTCLREAEASASVERGTYLVLPAADVFDNLDQAQQQTFSKVLGDLVQSHRFPELVSKGQLSIETVENLAAAAQHIRYKTELAELRDMIDGKKVKPKRLGAARLTEHEYQHWFEEHTWVFGTEYTHRIDLREIDTNATVDFIMATADGFYDVLELKLPNVTVLSWDRSHKTLYWTGDVAKVIAQAVKYLHAIEQNCDKLQLREKVALVRPRVRVVIGRSDKWTPDEHEAFRRLGAALHGIDLMTYDHVVERAQQLITRYDAGPDVPTSNVAASRESADSA